MYIYLYNIYFIFSMCDEGKRTRPCHQQNNKIHDKMPNHNSIATYNQSYA